MLLRCGQLSYTLLLSISLTSNMHMLSNYKQHTQQPCATCSAAKSNFNAGGSHVEDSQNPAPIPEVQGTTCGPVVKTFASNAEVPQRREFEPWSGQKRPTVLQSVDPDVIFTNHTQCSSPRSRSSTMYKPPPPPSYSASHS